MSFPRTIVNTPEFSVKQDLPASHLQPGKWDPGNYSILKNWLKELRESSPPDSVTAVFDFDNTCIYGDVGKAVFRYQLMELHFRLPPDEFAELFPEYTGTINTKPFELIKSRIIALYRVLWPFILSDWKKAALQLPEYHEFHVLLSWYCNESRRHQQLGAEYSLLFLAKLLAGYTGDEIEALSYRAIVAATYEKPGIQKMTVKCSKPIGLITVSYTTGLRVQPEIIDLMTQLRRTGIHCSIVSASTEWIVKAAAIFFDFPADKENIFGIRLRLNAENVLSTMLPDNYPLTYREGKVSVIKKVIRRVPILVAGDATTDFEMLTLPLVPVRLLINHNKSDLISSLYHDPRFLLQGLDKGTGSFRPHRETIGKIEEHSSSLKQQLPSQYSMNNAASLSPVITT